MRSRRDSSVGESTAEIEKEDFAIYAVADVHIYTHQAVWCYTLRTREEERSREKRMITTLHIFFITLM